MCQKDQEINDSVMCHSGTCCGETKKPCEKVGMKESLLNYQMAGVQSCQYIDNGWNDFL